jgi:TrmH RNA methyltransferase
MPHPDRPSRPPRPDARRNDGPRDDARPARRDDTRAPLRNDGPGPRNDAPNRARHDAPRPPDRNDPRGPNRDAPRSDARTDRPTRNDPRDEPRGPRRDLRDDRGPRRDDPPRDEPRAELKVCGVNACQAVAERRPDDVRRVYIRESSLPEFGPFLRRCAANRIAYHVVDDDELAKITQSTHHEGVCFIVRERPPASLQQLLAVPGARCLIYLDDVQNPHNLGAIVRVCAHFGAAAVLLAGSDGGVSTAMLRTAEGGGEWVDLVPVEPGPAPLLAARAAGFRLIATAARAPHDLHARRLPQRIILMLGSESHGLSPAVAKLADESVRIPGTGKLDSLNVACACAVLLSEYWRTHHAA